VRHWITLCEASWDTDDWWEPKSADSHQNSFYATHGVPAEVENRYSNAQCTWLALAMAERYGWPIKAEMMTDQPTHIAHAYCVMPDGREIDILGPQDRVDIFSGGSVRTYTVAEFLEWLRETDQNAQTDDSFNDHMNDARKAVDLFIAPKV
jgi:hypothetical protein